MSKEAAKGRNKGQGRSKQSGLDIAISSGEQRRENKGKTRIDTLQQTYGDSFARRIRGDGHLQTLLNRTGSHSLSDYLKTTGKSQVGGKQKEEQVNEKASDTHYASDQQFKEAHRKTSKLHAGLFRRLAE